MLVLPKSPTAATPLASAATHLPIATPQASAATHLPIAATATLPNPANANAIAAKAFSKFAPSLKSLGLKLCLVMY